VGGGAQLGPLGTAATNRPIVPAPGDYDDGEFGGMMTGRGNRRTRRKPAPMPLCPPQIPHAARSRTRAAAVGIQRLTTWATARPSHPLHFSYMSRDYGCVTKITGSAFDDWIYWQLFLQLLLIAISYNNSKQSSNGPFFFDSEDLLHSPSRSAADSVEFCCTQSQSKSHVTTSGLSPISSSWRQVPWDSRQVILFSKWIIAVIVLM
jgi:hypothetical protein